MEIGIPGSDVFGSVQHKDAETGELSSLDFFQTLNSMVQALENGSGEDVRALTDKISSVLEHAIVQQSSIGARMSRVESMQGTLEQRDFTFQQLQSQLEDLDYVEAASRLKNETLALQAGQQTFAQISGLSLFKYIN
jgi:flagellar hook-associated protein 3 FlgL